MAFAGRQQEGRALLLSVRAGRGVVLSAPPGYGKSALLEEVRPALEAWSKVVWCDKIAPFGSFLKDLFRGLWDARIPVEGVPLSRDLEADLKAWGRRYPTSDEKAKSLVRALRRYAEGGVNRVTVVVDDASGVQGSMVPWLLALTEAATLVLALFLALGGFALWPLSGDGFDTAFRRLVASPETAVVDYLKWREEREVWAELKGFNRESQEALEGRFRVVEAVGREGILIEDELGRTLEVSHGGQVVAYRVRAYPGEAIRLREYRLDLSGRLLGDLLASLPRQARRVWVTGALEAATDPPPLVSPVGTYPRVRVSGRAVELHAARPEDLTPLAAVYARAGNLIVRAEFKPGQEASLALPPLPATPQVHPVLIEGLPSLAGLLVQPGDRVEAGEPLARYVDDAPLQDLAEQAAAKREEAARLEGELTRLQERHQAERERPTLERVTALQAEARALPS